MHHRDVKPNNALVDAAGRVTLVDFGVALIADRPRQTGGDRRPGTPAIHELLVGAPASPSARSVRPTPRRRWR